MTPLFRRIIAENRLTVMTLSLALLANLLAYVLIVRPLEAKSTGAADRAGAAENSLRAAEGEMAQSEGLLKG